LQQLPKYGSNIPYYIYETLFLQSYIYLNVRNIKTGVKITLKGQNFQPYGSYVQFRPFTVDESTM
jgi:hypothetical protein